MDLRSSAIRDGSAIPRENAFCVPDPRARVSFGPNRNPDLSWSGTPEAAMSLAIVCVDIDVPTRPDDVNQEGREVPADLPRADFYHWIAVDLPPHLPSVAAGEFADGVVPHGRSSSEGPHGSRQGVNDYTSWFADDPDMAGEYFGYDGPCPPWNDALIHRYEFRVYALDVARTDVSGAFTGEQLLAAIDGHVLDSASISGTYTLNPRLR